MQMSHIECFGYSHIMANFSREYFSQKLYNNPLQLLAEQYAFLGIKSVKMSHLFD